MNTNKGIKSYNIKSAVFCAMFFGFSSIYFIANLVPIFLDVAKLINDGETLGLIGWITVLLLTGVGIFTYFLSTCFALFQRRVLDYIYEGGNEET